nr:hypothetical protein [Tanacetum cinerariifolium]
KEDKNCIPRHLISLVEDFDAWKDYPWGFYSKCRPLFNSYREDGSMVCCKLSIHQWLVDEDRSSFVVDYVGVSKDNAVDGQHELGYEDERVNEPLVDEDRMVVGVNSLGVSKDNVVDGQHQLGYEDERKMKHWLKIMTSFYWKTGMVFWIQIDEEVVVIKVDDERIVNLERLLKEKLQNGFATEKIMPNMISNHSDDISNCSIPYVTSNHRGVDQGLGGSANDPMLACSRPDMHNAKVTYDGMSIDKPDGKNEYTYS